MTPTTRLTCLSALLSAAAALGLADGAPGVRAALEPAQARQAAPQFQLKDSAGKRLKLKKYRGKVVLLDFWATWCHGCKEEIPWFSEFQRRYGKEGLRVVGVSLDEDGWKAVKPFLATANIPYAIAVGGDAMAKTYSIESMPDSFLIDRHGRIAAVYRGLVDRDDMEANLRSMLEER